jgi:hypothetical protein
LSGAIATKAGSFTPMRKIYPPHPIILLGGTMKSITIFKHNGDTFGTYSDIFAVSTENGILSFRWMLKPGDQSTATKVMTSLPFCLEDDLEG